MLNIKEYHMLKPISSKNWTYDYVKQKEGILSFLGIGLKNGTLSIYDKKIKHLESRTECNRKQTSCYQLEDSFKLAQPLIGYFQTQIQITSVKTTIQPTCTKLISDVGVSA